jgi:hypothetical protein
MIGSRPLFIIGSKRSGSTLLVNMLNEHPKIGVTHESDIVWALFQAKDSFPQEFQCFELDAPRGLRALLNAYRETMKSSLGKARPSEDDLRTTFFEIQRKVIESGTEMHIPLKAAEGLQWVGDKKPVQQAFPAVRGFIEAIFPDALFIHLIRSPHAVIGSQMSAAATWPVVPSYWKGTPSELLTHWCTIEEWVLDLKAAHTSQVCTVRLEDLANDPCREMSRLFEFLSLEAPMELLQRLNAFTYADVNSKHGQVRLRVTKRARRLMNLYFS